MAQYNFKTSDQDVIEFLKSADNKSRTIVTALKEKRLQSIKTKQKEPIKAISINKRRVLKVLVS